MRIAYVNGFYVPQSQASVNIEDRGYQFADGVYEVICLVRGRFIDLEDHLTRLEQSLRELRIFNTVDRHTIRHISQEVIRLNRIQDGALYIQVTRGVAPRYHGFPKHPQPSLVVSVKYINQRSAMKKGEKGVSAITLPDQRWARPDIKSISLLPNVLGKQMALDSGAYEAILYSADGLVTETNSTNVWIVDSQGRLMTPPVSQKILAGVTRNTLIRLLTSQGVSVHQQNISLGDLSQAKEIILSASVSGITPVVTLDGQPVGLGQTGQVAKQMSQLYLSYTGG